MILEQNRPPESFGDEKISANQRDAHIMPLPIGCPPAKLIRHLAESRTSIHFIHHAQKCPVDGHRTFMDEIFDDEICEKNGETFGEKKRSVIFEFCVYLDRLYRFYPSQEFEK